MRKLPSDAFRSEIKKRKELLQTNNGFTDEINLICGSATSTSNENVISLNENKQIWNKIRARIFFFFVQKLISGAGQGLYDYLKFQYIITQQKVNIL